MNENRQTTEKEIITIAKKVFLEKGYMGATMRDIAQEAHINLAMLNYYFGSKDKLFDIIFEETFACMTQDILPLAQMEIPMLEMMNKFVSIYIDGFIANPIIPGFLFSEVHNNPDRLLNKFLSKTDIHQFLTLYQKRFEQEVSRGEIRPLQAMDFMISVISMCAFPFVAKPIIEGVFNCSDKEYMNMMQTRKAVILDTVQRMLIP
ncbi:MAG: TetR/AcrR family transcriptional regulator [Bacteroidales bacterium]